jgi:hypothetical protein
VASFCAKTISNQPAGITKTLVFLSSVTVNRRLSYAAAAVQSRQIIHSKISKQHSPNAKDGKIDSDR